MWRALPLVVCSLVSTAWAQDMPLSQVLIEDEVWEEVSRGHKFTEGPAVDRQGNVYFTDIPENKIFKVTPDGNVTLFAENTAHTNGLMFGPDGQLYGCRNGDKQIVRYTDDGRHDVVAEDITSNDLVVTSAGGIYVTDPPGQRVWYLAPPDEEGKRDRRIVAHGYRPNGIILWPDEGTLVVTDSEQPHLWTYRVEPSGSLSFGERYYRPVRRPPYGTRPGSDGMTVDRDGRLYLASSVGLQMFDPTGRISGVIAKPQDSALSNVVFGGPKFDTLYVTCADKVYRRKTKTAGAPYFLRAKK